MVFVMAWIEGAGLVYRKRARKDAEKETDWAGLAGETLGHMINKNLIISILVAKSKAPREFVGRFSEPQLGHLPSPPKPTLRPNQLRSNPERD